MSDPSGSADKPTLREMQFAALKHDISTARPLKDVVLGEIRSGVRPEWIAVKYGHLGVTLERVLIAKAEIERRTEAAKAVTGRD